MVAVLEVPAVGLVRPRIFVEPASPGSMGAKAVGFARRVGLGLDPEQELVLEGSMGVREDGRWQAFEVGFNAPRQNGKGEVLMARELFGLYELGEMFLVHSAHEFKTSERHFARVEAAIRRCPELLARVKRTATGRLIGFRYSHGDEAIELQSGARIEFRTRTKAGMRGFDDVAFIAIDEAMIYPEAAQSAMMPTVRASTAKRGPQLWYAGSAVDQEVHEHGVVWTRVRERALAGDDPSLCYAEWSLDFDHPDKVPDEVAEDAVEWRKANFAIGRGRVLEEQMWRELRSMSRRGFLVELLGVGDWPATDGTAASVFSLEVWDSLAADPKLSRLMDPVCLAYDVSPERRASVAAAGRNSDGFWQVEVLDDRAGTGWLPRRLLELVAKHDPLIVVGDGYGPAASIASIITEAGVPVVSTSSGEHAQACGLLMDAVEEKTLRHLGSAELRLAVSGAATRPLGDAWAWSRKQSSVNISPLVASTLALWAAVNRPDMGGDVAIY